jgi:RNA 2',3'-cyclic 3'-phosphodiesterase
LAGKRLFISTKLSCDFLDELTSAVKYLKRELACEVNWVNPENCHITYAFLGDVLPDKGKVIIEKIKAVKVKKFFISAGYIDSFPFKGRPRIIWLGINRGADNIQEVAENLRADARSEGFAFKDKFYSHITLGRVRREKMCGKSFKNVFAQATKLIDRSLSFEVVNIELFESILSAQGPVYRSLYKKELI